MTIAASAALPMGTFGELVQTGFGVALRSGIGDTREPWSGRGSFGFDYFKGNGKPGRGGFVYDNVQFITGGFDIVHQSSDAFYQFGGVALMNVKQAYVSAVPGLPNTRHESDFALTGGVGVNFGSSNLKGFVEFAATTVFTSGDNSAWFPVRVGLRF